MVQTMTFPEKTLHDLEWSRLLDHLASLDPGAGVQPRLPMTDELRDLLFRRLLSDAEGLRQVLHGDSPTVPRQAQLTNGQVGVGVPR